VGVEPTTRLAKSRINGFEGHEDHRTPFASARIIAGEISGALSQRSQPLLCGPPLATRNFFPARLPGLERDAF
jgi:hypothetical protein